MSKALYFVALCVLCVALIAWNNAHTNLWYHVLALKKDFLTALAAEPLSYVLPLVTVCVGLWSQSGASVPGYAWRE